MNMYVLDIKLFNIYTWELGLEPVTLTLSGN